MRTERRIERARTAHILPLGSIARGTGASTRGAILLPPEGAEKHSLPVGFSKGDDFRPASILSGRLSISWTDHGACASVGDRASFLWPKGYAVMFDPALLLDADGQYVASEGDEITVGGGFGRPGATNRCGSTDLPVWFVSSAFSGHPGQPAET
jgi:hypothetical protein